MMRETSIGQNFASLQTRKRSAGSDSLGQLGDPVGQIQAAGP